MKNIASCLTQTFKKWNSTIFAIAALLALTMCCSIAFAQSGAGSIQGTVADSTGAVIPGASIHLVNPATSVAANTKSNSVGFYQVPGLFTGTYDVTITAPGMKSYKTTIQLLVAQTAVINAALTPGEVTQQVVVSGNAVQLTTTDSGTIDATLENQRINQLPMNGRDLWALAQETTPGLETGGVSMNGLTGEALEYVLDGVTTKNMLLTGQYTSEKMDPDAVQEVRMVTSGSGAQYATPATGIVTTKSGTNALHGTFFETARNNATGIAKDRQDPSNFSAPKYIRNEFGGAAGGPIVLPHIYHGKDKSFWFFSYERYSLATSTAVLASVPTPAMSQGDFSGLVTSAGLVQQLYDPASTKANAACPTLATVSGVQLWNGGTPANNPYCRTPFGNGIGNSSANNQIPVGEESPMAKLYFQLVPLPTSTANPLVSTNLTSVNPQIVIEPQETFRLDHEFNENNRAYVRYTENTNLTNISGGPLNRAADGIPVGAAENYVSQPNLAFMASVGYTHVFSPNFFSETVASQQWFNDNDEPGADPQTDYESMLGLPNNFGEPGWPAFGGGALIENLPGSQTGNAQVGEIIWNIDENLTKTVGRHQMQFGGRFRRSRNEDKPNGNADSIPFSVYPTAIYATSSGANYTQVPNTGYSQASLFIGNPSSYEVDLEPPHVHYHDMEYDAYFQDNYHVSKNITINLGLRYEAHPAMWTKYGLNNTFDLKNDAQVLEVPPSTLISEGYTTQAIITNDENIGVTFETPEQAGMNNKLMRNYDLNFLPRAGIAYQPFGGKYGTVIRGAYGRFDFFTGLGNFANHPEASNPLTAAYTQSYIAAAQAIDGLPDELLRYNDPVQFGVMGLNTANVVNSASTNSILPGIALFSTSQNWPPAAVTETNFTVEQPLKGNSVLRVSWVWTHGTNLDTALDYNFHPTTYQYEMAYGIIPPAGGASVIGTPQQNTYSTTATGPYNQTTWGTGSSMHLKNGWSNDNALQVDYQRLFHHGIAYQFSYVYSHPLRFGGDNGAIEAEKSLIYPDADFPGVQGALGTMTSPYGTLYPGVPPPARPAGLPVWADYHAMDDYQGYMLDSPIPQHHIKFNGVVDLPFGTGKRFLGNSNRFVNELVGGFQLAGDGNILSQVFQPSGAGMWGPVSPIKVYKHRYPITDCRSGVCQKSFLWYNNYLAPTVTTGVAGSTCITNCVSGLPSDYVPFQTPIDNTPGTTYYGTSDVVVTLANGKTSTIAYDAGPLGSNYLQNSWVNGPFNYTVDLSIFKVFPITEKVNLRFNMDAFNALNVQGWNSPATNSVETNLSSYNTPRQIQLSLRLTY
jgi:hypothetical protein